MAFSSYQVQATLLCVLQLSMVAGAPGRSARDIVVAPHSCGSARILPPQMAGPLAPDPRSLIAPCLGAHQVLPVHGCLLALRTVAWLPNYVVNVDICLPVHVLCSVVGWCHGGYCHWRRRGCRRCRCGHGLLLQEAPCSHVTRRNRCYRRLTRHEHDQGQGCVHGGSPFLSSCRFFTRCRFASRSICSASVCAATTDRARALAATVGRDAQPGLLVGRGLGHEHVGAAGGCRVTRRLTVVPFCILVVVFGGLQRYCSCQNVGCLFSSIVPVWCHCFCLSSARLHHVVHDNVLSDSSPTGKCSAQLHHTALCDLVAGEYM
jgi:hypothetical protein